MSNQVATRGATLTALALAGLLALGPGRASGQRIGVGIIAGEPTGLCGKVWLNGSEAVAGAAAWSFRHGGAVHLHADYLRHFDVSGDAHVYLGPEAARLRPTVHYGLGGRLHAGDESRLSLRLPIGFTGHLPQAPADFFVELAPMLDLTPETALDLSAAVGLRYYF
jgi:hypothetical protein